MAKPSCWVELRYGWGLKGVSVAQTGNPNLLRQCKDILLAEAKRKAEISRHVDAVLGSIEMQELKKLQAVLDLLIPDDVEAGSG